MNKGLEILEKVKHYDSRVGLHEDDYNTIEKELKALEVIKERLDIGIVILGDKPKLRITFQNMLRFYDITQEEYDLLKEVHL